jgi:hypothetical protein
MRRVFSRGVVGALLAGITLLAVSACSLPPGTDGDLTNQWPAMGAPSGWEPKSGVCSMDFAVQAYRATYNPLDCTQGHRYETIVVGQFTGNAANLSSPPAAGSPELKAAWAECDAKTTEFLGGEWRNGKIWISVSTPSPGNWTGGARWYRCEAGAREQIWGDVIYRSKSLKGELAGDSPLRIGCYQDGDNDRVEKACTEPHNMEFSGTVKVSYEFADLKNHRDEFFQKCRSNIAVFVGVPDDGNMKYRTGVAIDWPGQADWTAGDNAVRCFMWLNKETKSKSVKGAGNSGLPIHYA